jgi:hypothetical protein
MKQNEINFGQYVEANPSTSYGDLIRRSLLLLELANSKAGNESPDFYRQSSPEFATGGNSSTPNIGPINEGQLRHAEEVYGTLRDRERVSSAQYSANQQATSASEFNIG